MSDQLPPDPITAADVTRVHLDMLRDLAPDALAGLHEAALIADQLGKHELAQRLRDDALEVMADLDKIEAAMSTNDEES